MSNLGDNVDEEIEEVLTSEERNQIEKLKLMYKLNKPDAPVRKVQEQDTFYAFFLHAAVAALPALNVSNPKAEDQTYARILGFKHKIMVNNISGKKAWLILSPAPIFGVSSIGIDSVGQIAFSTTGDYKCQQSPLLDNSSREFDLDNNQIYYTVFFDCNGKWKVHFKDRKINAKRHDINLLSRHIEEAVDYDFIPV
jgi:hypothetical protein